MNTSHYKIRKERAEQLASKAAALGRTEALALARWLHNWDWILANTDYEFAKKEWWRICRREVRFANRAEDMGYIRGADEDVF